MSVATESTTVMLGRNEALVLFELLAEFEDQSCVHVRNEGERQALWRLHGALESVLVEPFTPDYRAKVATALAELSASTTA